jgi:hypothetical protein
MEHRVRWEFPRDLPEGGGSGAWVRFDPRDPESVRRAGQVLKEALGQAPALCPVRLGVWGRLRRWLRR